MKNNRKKQLSVNLCSLSNSKEERSFGIYIYNSLVLLLHSEDVQETLREREKNKIIT